jgi:hypothetical protein
MHQRAVPAREVFRDNWDLNGKSLDVASARVGSIGASPASYKLPCREVSLSLRANDEHVDYIDSPKLREFHLTWCDENGFEPIAVGVAA